MNAGAKAEIDIVGLRKGAPDHYSVQGELGFGVNVGAAAEDQVVPLNVIIQKRCRGSAGIEVLGRQRPFFAETPLEIDCEQIVVFVKA